MIKFVRPLLVAAALFLGSAAWAQPVPVVASFSILADVAQSIGGERIKVESLVPINADAHSYALTPTDLRKIRAARLLLVNGLGFENAAVMRAMQGSKIPLAVVSKGVETLKVNDGHGHDETDPHVWQDPVRMQTYARHVAEALMQADPASKAHYTQRLANYQRELQQLHTWAQQQFAAVPVAQRKVLTAHDAFAYLGARYQVDFVAPLGANASGDASAKTVARIIQQVRQQKVRAVFLENVKDARLVQQLARETGLAVHRQPLYSDALSAPQSVAPNYLQLMRHNIGAIAGALRAAGK
ncbi:MAG: zinc ABC transporter substrate-binding protein [Brachymonas sp.]|nr:zinc ABC transporter substrate-binding protein [Brachymonas sp.]